MYTISVTNKKKSPIFCFSKIKFYLCNPIKEQHIAEWSSW